MKSPFNEWSDEIRRYCAENSLDFEKIRYLVKSWNRDNIVLQYHDPKKGADGLLDETPMPAVLFISRQPDGTLSFEQTEHTRKYLS